MKTVKARDRILTSISNIFSNKVNMKLHLNNIYNVLGVLKKTANLNMLTFIKVAKKITSKQFKN